MTWLTAAPYVVIVVLCSLLFVEHEKINVAQADIKLEASQCATEISNQVAKVNADTVTQLQAAQAANNTQEQEILALKAQEQQQQIQTNANLQNQIQKITTQATQTGQDGTVPPVLLDLFQ